VDEVLFVVVVVVLVLVVVDEVLFVVVVVVVVWTKCCYLLFILSSALLRLTASAGPFAIFKLVLSYKWKVTVHIKKEEKKCSGIFVTDSVIRHELEKTKI
jgi:hypothetical protein